jgi:hypothetical protein
MAGKVTLYVRDEELWSRARAWGGPGGLSELVDQSLRDWLDRHTGDVREPSILERSRRVLAEAEALVAALERTGASRRRRTRAPGEAKR